MASRKKPYLFFPKRQILNKSKLKEFANDNFRFDENGRKFTKRVENTAGKEEIACDKLKCFFYKQCFASVLTHYQTTTLDWSKFKQIADRILKCIENGK